jgi:hypothetical protein
MEHRSLNMIFLKFFQFNCIQKNIEMPRWLYCFDKDFNGPPGMNVTCGAQSLLYTLCFPFKFVTKT